MRQVPKNSAHFTIIGDGKLAKHLFRYFDLLGLTYSRWNRSLPENDLFQHIESGSHVLLCISDESLRSFFNEHLDRLQKSIVVHFSGATQIDGAFCVHPMMSFGESLFELSEYQKIPFNVFQKTNTLHELLPGLPNPSFVIPENQKSIYHAQLALCGNIPQWIWLQSISPLESLGLPLSSLESFISQSFKNVSLNGLSGVTGPIKRSDSDSIEQNINDIPDEFIRNIYHLFAKQYSSKESQL